MAEMRETGAGTAGRHAPRLTMVTNVIGAMLSLTLIVGIGIWGYKTLMRDVSGVPVVRAADGPMRTAPADPGGQLAEHLGLSVNDVAAAGSAAAPADRLALAPPPVDLSAEDTPVGAGGAAPAPVVDGIDGGEAAAMEQLAEELTAGLTPLSELAPLSEVQPVTEEQVRAAIVAITGVEPEVIRPPDLDGTAEPAADETDMAEPQEAEQAVTGGLGRSLRPQQRPVTLGDVQPVAAVMPASATAEVDPETIPVGTRLAQLGAFDSDTTARREWDRLNTRFGEYLAGKSRVVQQASSGGRTFYRLRAMGFADLGDARRFCAMLIAEDAECIPVVTR